MFVTAYSLYNCFYSLSSDFSQQPLNGCLFVIINSYALYVLIYKHYFYLSCVCCDHTIQLTTVVFLFYYTLTHKKFVERMSYMINKLHPCMQTSPHRCYFRIEKNSTNNVTLSHSSSIDIQLKFQRYIYICISNFIWLHDK